MRAGGRVHVDRDENVGADVAYKDEVVEDLNSVLGQAISLVVGRLAGQEIETQRLLIQGDVGQAFADQTEEVNQRIGAATVVAYEANAELNSGEVFLIEEDATLVELNAFTVFADDIGAIQAVSPGELDLKIKFYAVAVGDQDRVVYVKKTDPSVAHKAGRFFAVGQERLTRVQEPDFSFSADFDFVLGPGWAVVLNQKSFEMLFRSVGLVQQHVDSWIEGVTDHLPMASESLDKLREVAIADSRLWRRLKEIKSRGHLANVTLKDVRTYAKAMDMDPDTVVEGDELVFDPAQRFGFLQLLNEDLYRGQLTKTIFESQRKATAD